jgi:hypothetical protein
MNKPVGVAMALLLGASEPIALAQNTSVVFYLSKMPIRVLLV